MHMTGNLPQDGSGYATGSSSQSSFPQLGNSGKSAFSVKDKGLANVKMYVE